MHSLSLKSSLRIRKIPNNSIVPARSLSFTEIIKYSFPHSGLSEHVNKWKVRNLPNLWRGLWRVVVAKHVGIPYLSGQLRLATINPRGIRTDYGLASLRMITTTGAAFVIDAFQGLNSLSSMRYHGLGSGSAPESASDTTLGTELSAVYVPINTRAEGTLGEGDSSTFFRSIGFVTVSDTVTIAEHMLFSQAAVGGGVGLDRSAIASQTIFAYFTVECDYILELATGT